MQQTAVSSLNISLHDLPALTMFRIRLRWLMILTLLTLCGFLAAAFWGGTQLASPTRRALQDYHLDFLANPSAHGVSVRHFHLSDRTPCLIIEPLPSGTLGSRGQRLRSQLLAEKIDFPAPGKILGTLVLVHGRTGRKEDYLLIAERLCAVGFRCLLPDMPAHGEHPEACVTYGIREAGIPARTLKESAEQFNFQSAPSGLLGMSMGGAVAMQTAAMPKCPWKALVIISSFDRLETAIQKNVSDLAGPTLGHIWAQMSGWVYEWKTGIRLQDIRSDLPAQKISTPTLITHGADDHVIPISSGVRLFAALPEALEKRWIVIPKADHANVLITDFPIYAEIAKWMLNHIR